MVAAVTGVLLPVGMPIAYLGGNTTTGDVIGLCGMLILSFGVMAAGFLWLVPRERAAGRSARTALGLTARADSGERRATAAVVIGAIVIVASFVLLLVG